MSAAQGAPSRRGVLIGINEYPLCLSRLYGCVNDAELMHQLLRDQFQFPAHNLTLLRDAEATREAIIRALEDLYASIERDDVVVVFFAGHGSRVRDLEGTKISGWDESWMPADTGRHIYPNLDINDDELRLWLLRLSQKTRYITLIFDCCHSATLHRDAFACRARGFTWDARSIAARPPWPSASAKDASEVPPSGTATRSWLPASNSYVVLSACRDDENAREIPISSGADTVMYGVFTYHLAQELARAAPGCTYRDVLERTAQRVSCDFPSQHPCGEGALDRLLFGIVDPPKKRYIQVAPISPDEVRFEGGQPQGVEIGSLWALESAASTEPRCLIEVVSAGPLSAIGRVRVPTGSRVGEHGRALLHRRPPAQCWPIEVHDPHKNAELAAHIADSPWLRLARPEEPAFARVYSATARSRSGPDDPLPQLSSLREDSYLVVGRDGGLLMRPLPLSRMNAVHENLDKLARRSMVRGLANPTSSLQGKIAFTLNRKLADHTFHAVHQHPEEIATVPAGCRITLQLTNMHPSPLYVVILLLDADGNIEQIYPPENGTAELIPGPARSYGDGIGEGEEFLTAFPSDLTFAVNGDGSESQDVIDYYKLIVSTHPIQCGLLLTGARIRGALLHGYEPDWATETRALRIIR